MKKLLNWLFSDFLYNLYQWVERKYTLSIAVDKTFALFKNGVEIFHTRFTVTPPNFVSGGYFQVTGNATIDISQTEIDLNTGDIELRTVSTSAVVTLGGPDIGGSPIDTLRASLNFEKVGDPIVP